MYGVSTILLYPLGVMFSPLVSWNTLHSSLYFSIDDKILVNPDEAPKYAKMEYPKGKSNSREGGKHGGGEVKC